MASLSEAELRAIRGSKIAMVYQEPMASLNPTMLVGRQLMEVPLIHDRVSRDEARRRAIDMVKAVRLPDPERVMRAYPHQLSGGQQQRVVIAMALLSNPELLILDEPTTALDVTVEAGIVALIKDLTARTGASSLFISHNLGLILETCDEVTVMYSGEAVETGAVRDVFGAVRHPYTQGLFRSMPMPGTNKNDNPLVPIPGQLPLPHQRPKGCNFGPRCPHFVEGLCDAADVAMLDVAGASGHHSRCLRVEAIDWAALSAPRRGSSRSHRRDGPGGRAAEEALPGRRERPVRQAGEPRSQGGRGHLLRRPRGGGSGDRRRIGLRQVDPGQGALGLETASEGLVVFDHEAIQNQPVESRAVKTIASIQMIFQNPFDTLNPSYSVGSQIVRTLEKFRVGANNAERRDIMLRLLDLVKLPRAFAGRSPRQLSGGQKQRIGVARAFAGRPRVIIADEPMSALDVSVQAAISELLMSLQREVENDDGVHQPRSVGRALSRRPGPRDVSRPYRRNGLNRADLLAAVPPLYGSAAVRDSHRRRAGEKAPCGARGRDPLGAVAAERLPLPDAVRPQERSSGGFVRARIAADPDRRRGTHHQMPSADRDARAHGAGFRMTMLTSLPSLSDATISAARIGGCSDAGLSRGGRNR